MIVLGAERVINQRVESDSLCDQKLRTLYNPVDCGDIGSGMVSLPILDGWCSLQHFVIVPSTVYTAF